MEQLQIIDSTQLGITIERLCEQLIEMHDDFKDTVLVGLQPRGIFLAQRIQKQLGKLLHQAPELGLLDITFFRDDFRRRDSPLTANATHMPFLIEDKKVILIDDVLYTGRSIRAALSAMAAYGRPSRVELLVLIDRRYNRDLPIEASYIGRKVNTLESEKVLVEWQEQGAQADQVYLTKEI